MFCYSTTYINILSFVISIIIFLITNLFISKSNIFMKKNYFDAEVKVNNTNIQTSSKESERMLEEVEEWYLEIPSINLKANIKEGTTEEIMDEYIGHFEESQKENGNVCLAAHNRGYKNNYFENIKNLKEGDRIYYKHRNYKKEYEVIKQSIIKDTDWTNLENTIDNTITLITCVENQKEYRRCVQGKEIIKESEEN